MQNRNNIITTMLLALGFFALPQRTQATPLPGFNTADGQNALSSVTTGVANTGIGWFSLKSNTDGSFNTGVGAGTLLLNIGNQSTGDGVENTAFGAAALLFNTTGSQNTANGTAALLSNTTGGGNTATGDSALYSNTTGVENTALGSGALLNNISGNANAASGTFALFSNTIGNNNTANGVGTLASNTTGVGNTAIGRGALAANTAGNGNTALGANAGSALTTGNNNIDIGVDVIGGAGEANTMRIGNTNITTAYIRGISGQITAGGVAVFVASDGHLGTMTSSARFKDEIRPMGNASEAILALRPVSFRYKKEIDPQGIPEFGLIAEEVEKVNPDLVIRDPEGKPYTVRYEQINAMLLNEFLREHRNNEQQKATIAQLKQEFSEQRTQIEALTAGLQKVSAQLEASKSAPQVVNNP